MPDNLYQSKFYRAWSNMKTRCTNEKYHGFSLWGGRGIKYCKKWETFGGFLDDMYQSYLEHVDIFGEKNTSLDRIDNNSGYSKKNCRWATKQEQSLNTRNVERAAKLQHDGKLLTIAEWSKLLNIKRGTISQRYHAYGWDVPRCLSTK